MTVALNYLSLMCIKSKLKFGIPLSQTAHKDWKKNGKSNYKAKCHVKLQHDTV